MTSEETIEALEIALEQLLDDYRDLQSPEIVTLSASPTSLEALRMIHRAQPSVIRGYSPLTLAADEHDWTKPEAYLRICDEEVTVAITDDGLADSVRRLPDGTTTFVKALDVQMTISELISRLGPRGKGREGEAYYLQSQDGNIYRSVPRGSDVPELRTFQPYIKRDVEWMKEAVGSEAEAVNLWLGDRKSTTSLHHDPYENVYCVLAGSKTFTLLSPIEGLWLDQHFHPSSTLHRTASGSLQPTLDEEPTYPIPWVSSSSFPSRVRPIRVTLQEGDTLFLPAEWWHRVEQEEGDNGIVAAVNYWYTAEIHPQTYAYERLARRIARQAGRSGVIPVPGDEEVPEGVWGNDGAGSVDVSDEEWDPANQGEMIHNRRNVL